MGSMTEDAWVRSTWANTIGRCGPILRESQFASQRAECPALSNMFKLWHRTPKFASCEISKKQSSEQSVEQADRLIAAGQMLEDYSEFEAALQQYRDGLAAAPSYPRAHMNVGNALVRLNRYDEAVAAHQRAIECDPRYAPAHFNLGSLLLTLGDASAAELEMKEALRLQPDMFQASIVLADICEAQSRFDEAEEHFLNARRVVPDHAGTILNYGTFCFRRDRFDEAMALFERVKALQPQFTDAESTLLFSTNFHPDLNADAVAEEHKRVGRLVMKSAGPPFTQWANVANGSRRLRIGYVSGDFLNHPVALFLRPVLEMQDRGAFETFCFSNHAYPNPVADALREHADEWRNIADLDDNQVAVQVRRDAIDILVDLSGHTRRNRLAVFSRHPAPVQVTWLGYLNTTGLPAMDYRITDAHTDPPGETERLHTEQLVLMPHSQWCYAPWYLPEAVHEPHPDRPHALIFGSFNQFRKISEPCLNLWCRILRELPHSELLVMDVKTAELETNLRDRVARNGVDPARVTARGRQVILDYFSAIGNVDIALDTFPYNGATTTLDTLWMGVPIVGLRGERGISRGTYSILRSLGATELIARDVEDYIDINVRLARDRAQREHLRHTLRSRLSASPLMDAVGFTSALEERYREMWRAWCGRTASSLQATI
jgi:predicted O-linked N-acetylglucosamine transferase (SPINDLY family)